MSYLAMSAAPITENDGNNNNNSNESLINKKRQHNKTQKFRPSTGTSDFNAQKVNSVLQSIHNGHQSDDDDLGNYHPKGSAVSANHSDNFTPLNPYDFPKQQPQQRQEGMTNNNNHFVPQPADNEQLKLQELQSAFMNDAQVRDYYRKLTPTYQPVHNKSASTSAAPYSTAAVAAVPNDVLVEKLNFLIHLLEEQQDQKSGNVTEEVILYSFLGIFIIFVVDSFTKVGKYVR